MPRRTAIVLSVFASLGGMHPSCTAAQSAGVVATELVVRGRAVWSDVQVTRVDAGVEVSAVLRDDLGLPLAGVPVEVGLWSPRDPSRAAAVVTALSESDGRVTLRLESDIAGAARVELKYAGSALVEGTRTEAQVRLEQEALALSLDVPPQLNADAPPPFVVRLQDARGAPVIGAQVALSLDDAPPVLKRTRDDGIADFSVARISPGLHALTARVAGDARRADVVERRSFEAVRVPDVQARVSKIPTPDDAMSAPLVVEAEVTAPTPEALELRLLVDGKSASLARPDARGRATLQVPRRRLPAGPQTLEVEVSAREPHWATVRSSPMEVALPPHDARLDALIAWLASGLALGALFISGWAARRRGPAAAPQVRPPQPPALPDFEVFASRVPDPEDGTTTLVITALHAVSGSPIRAAVRWLEPVGEVTWTRDDGTATLRGPGLVLEVSAPGFVTARPRCPVNHAAEATVRLMPLRAAIQRALERWLVRWPDPRPLLGRETLVEVERRMRLTGYTEATVTPLMRAVEAALFSDVAPDEATLASVEAQLSALEPRQT